MVASMTLKGLKTFELRVERMSASAVRFADHMYSHIKVLKVNHTSLKSYYCKEQFNSITTRLAKERNLHSSVVTM